MIAAIEPHLEQILWWGSALSVLMLLASLIAAPQILARLPVDYFSHPERRSLNGISRAKSGGYYFIFNLLIISLKNLLGLSLVLMGVLMLFTPGQGLVTLLIGLMMMNFPGKYKLERILLRQPGVFKTINWLRRRKAVPPLESPE